MKRQLTIDFLILVLSVFNGCDIQGGPIGKDQAIRFLKEKLILHKEKTKDKKEKNNFLIKAVIPVSSTLLWNKIVSNICQD